MYLRQVTFPAVDPVSLEELKAHLRLSHGFADQGSEDALLQLYLSNATRAIESKLDQALIIRSFVAETDSWDRHGQFTLPVGPVAEITGLTFHQGETITPIAADQLTVSPGRSRQVLSARGGLPLPPVARGARAEIRFDAGYGPAGEDVPGELRQAILILAAHLYTHRGGGESQMPPASIHSLIAPHRAIRL